MDMSKMFGKMKDMQAKLKEVQENLASLTAKGESGGGMVKVTVNGKRKVLSMEIEEGLLQPEDRDMLSDLIVAAVNQALENIEGMINDEMRKTTEGILPNIPGMDFSKMFS